MFSETLFIVLHLQVFRNLTFLLVFFALELRKRARQIENELDLKLVSFSKLGTSYSHRDER